MTTEQWAVVDEAGAAHEVAVDEGRGSARSWWAATPDVARRSHVGARDAVVLVAQAQGWSIAEVLSVGQASRGELAAEVAHLEARRGALLAEVDRLTAALAVAREDAEQVRSERAMAADEVERRGDMIREARAEIAAARLDGAREMRERAAAEVGQWSHVLGGDAAADIRALPLPGEEVTRG